MTGALILGGALILAVLIVGAFVVGYAIGYDDGSER